MPRERGPGRAWVGYDMAVRGARKRTVRGNQAAVLIALIVVGWYGPGVSMGTTKPKVSFSPRPLPGKDIAVVKVPPAGIGAVNDHAGKTPSLPPCTPPSHTPRRTCSSRRGVRLTLLVWAG